MNREFLQRVNEGVAEHNDAKHLETKAHILIEAIALLPEPDSEFQRNLKRNWLSKLDDTIKELK